MRGAPLPDIPQTRAFLVSRLTWNAAVAVDLSSDKVTVRLRPGPRGRTNNGSACPHCFCIDRNQSLGHRQSGMVSLSGDKVHHYACVQRQLYGLATEYVMGTIRFSIAR